MTIAELHKKLIEKEIKEDSYFLHGLYGSKNDNEKLALSIKKGKFNLEYETYFKERGEKHSIRIFYSKNDACEYFYKQLTNE